MKLTDIRKKDIKTLTESSQKLRSKIALHRRAMALGEVTKHTELGNMKKELAQMLTIINEKASQVETPKTAPKETK